MPYYLKMDTMDKMESYMKKSIKLSLIGLFTLLAPARTYNMEGAEYKPFHQAPKTQHLQDPFFHEDRVADLEKARVAHEKEEGFLSRSGTRVRKTFQRIFYDDHRTVANAFNTSDIPNLNDAEKAAFKKLTPQEQLEFCNEWVANELNSNTKSHKKIKIRLDNSDAIHNPKINKLNRDIDRLKQEKKDFENSSWLKKWWHGGDTGIQAKITEIDKKLVDKKNELNTLNNNQKNSADSLKKENTKNNQATMEKIQNFIKTINPDLGNNQLRYNTKTHKFELHKNDTSLTPKTEDKKSPENLDQFWNRVGRSDFTGLSRDTERTQQAAKDVDELQEEFENSIKQETKRIFPLKQNLTEEEKEQRKTIIDEMSEILKNIFNKFKDKNINLEKAKEQSKQVLEQAEKKAEDLDKSSGVSLQPNQQNNTSPDANINPIESIANNKMSFSEKIKAISSIISSYPEDKIEELLNNSTNITQMFIENAISLPIIEKIKKINDDNNQLSNQEKIKEITNIIDKLNKTQKNVFMNTDFWKENFKNQNLYQPNSSAIPDNNQQPDIKKDNTSSSEDSALQSQEETNQKLNSSKSAAAPYDAIRKKDEPAESDEQQTSTEGSSSSQSNGSSSPFDSTTTSNNNFNALAQKFGYNE